MTTHSPFRLLLLLSIPALLPACRTPDVGAPPAPGVLRHRYQPGLELVYEFNSSLKQDMSVTGGEEVRHEMTLTGVTHQVVAEVSPSTGETLVGWLGKGRWSITAGAHGLTDTSRDQTWIAAYHTDRTGRALRRELATADARRYLLRRSLNQISEGTQLCAAFPSNAVAVGQSWAGPVLLPTPGTKQTGWAVSSVAEIRREGGTTLYVIRSRLSSGGEESHVTWRRDLSRPDMELSGTSEGVFDADQGFWRQLQLDLAAKMEGQGFSGIMKLQSTIRLASSGVLPGEKANPQRRRIRALDQALRRLYANQTSLATEMLEKQKDSESDADWRKGLEVALALVQQAMNPEPPIAAGHSAGAAGGAGTQAKATRDKAQQPPSASLELYKEAGAQAQAGNLQKAAELYEKFLAARGDDVQATTRLLAQYRLAGVFEKLGQRDKAVAGYQAVQSMAGDDDYSKSLKQKAAEKAKALAEQQK